MDPWIIILGVLGALYLFIISPYQEKIQKEKKEKKEKLVLEAQKRLQPILAKGRESYLGKHLFEAPCKELEGEYAKIAASYANRGMDFPLNTMTESKILGLIWNLSNEEIQEMISNLKEKGD